MSKDDLDALRSLIGTESTQNDGVLGMCLQAATAWVNDRIYPGSRETSEVAQATLLLAARLYKRRNSPEGVANWDDLGSIRILARDPDIERLLEQHIDVAKVYGIG